MGEKLLKDDRMCDFCGSWPYTQWWFSSQTIPVGTDVDFAIEMMEHPEWFACMECHILLLAHKVDELVDRAITAENEKSVIENEPKVREYLTKVYASLVEKGNK